jgi:hypothetical protein
MPEAARGKATYGSRANGTSDKENEQYDPDDSLAPLPDDAERNGNVENSLEFEQVKELKEAAKKFKEVDKWELEFEDVIASSSSPLGGRWSYMLKFELGREASGNIKGLFFRAVSVLMVFGRFWQDRYFILKRAKGLALQHGDWIIVE